MVITKTPFRISFLGGGTDYPVWYREHGGSTLAMAIDKYCYISCRYLPPFFEHKTRVAYTEIETVARNSDIRHPAVRAVLKYMAIEDGVEIHYDADLPARSGLGTSSAFTVGLLNAAYALQGRMASKSGLARDAIHVEQRLLQENVGCQDQIIAAHGGLCRIDLAVDDTFRVLPVVLEAARVRDFTSHILLCFTGIVRTASGVCAEQIRATPNRQRELRAIQDMVDQGLALLANARWPEFGRLLHEAWQNKRSLTSKITSATIDEMYAAGLNAGAYGGKLLGAGGGGFLLFFAPPEAHARIRARLSGLLLLSAAMDSGGSGVIFFSPETPFESTPTTLAETN